jgi:hypothetical protein
MRLPVRLLRNFHSEIDMVDILRGIIAVSVDGKPDFVSMCQINASLGQETPSDIVLEIW